ncbi:PREDICTED: PCI domain-containing protein 2-like [Priapulus caudatus]|uniref:CSN12-like protein n=1 Tax=Priapulus caudatus TaxID=37621 RepID=A0ABM1ET68_PRICU|nr:PREDICTED: PCI domain-containing protein 2-like [Priapulus caudatus]
MLIDNKDGLLAAEMLSFKHPHISNHRLQVAHPEAQVERYFDSPYDEMVAAHIRCIWAVSNHDFIEAYGCQTIVVQSFCKVLQSQKDENWSLPILFVVCLDLRLFANSVSLQCFVVIELGESFVISGQEQIGMNSSAILLNFQLQMLIDKQDGLLAAEMLSFKHPQLAITDFRSFCKVLQSQKDENWSLPILFVVCLDLRLFANSADIQLTKKGRGKPGDTLEKAADVLLGAFRICASDNRAQPVDSKKWGMLNLINQLFKIYFKVNKLHLCKPLIRAVDNSSLKEHFSLSQQVTYKYYVGRKNMFDSDFKAADEYLSYAFQHCHIMSRRNKRLILIYLVPVKMLLGYMPSVAVLKRMDLMQFHDIAQAVRQGNLLQLNAALVKHEAFFIKCGIFLILEKLKVITYRNLFKKVSCVLKTHQLPIEAFVVALRWMGLEDVDSDEAQCLIANLIYEGKIKGYISHQHQKLVVSKQNAFPPLTAIN